MPVVRLIAHRQTQPLHIIVNMGSVHRCPLVLGDEELNYRIEKHAGDESSVAYTGNADREKILSKLALLMHHTLGTDHPIETLYMVYENDILLAETRIPADAQEHAPK